MSVKNVPVWKKKDPPMLEKLLHLWIAFQLINTMVSRYFHVLIGENKCTCSKYWRVAHSLSRKAFKMSHLIVHMKSERNSSVMNKIKRARERSSNPAYFLTSAHFDRSCELYSAHSLIWTDSTDCAHSIVLSLMTFPNILKTMIQT